MAHFQSCGSAPSASHEGQRSCLFESLLEEESFHFSLDYDQATTEAQADGEICSMIWVQQGTSSSLGAAKALHPNTPQVDYDFVYVWQFTYAAHFTTFRYWYESNCREGTAIEVFSPLLKPPACMCTPSLCRASGSWFRVANERIYWCMETTFRSTYIKEFELLAYTDNKTQPTTLSTI